jgi:hypothetical protein
MEKETAVRGTNSEREDDGLESHSRTQLGGTEADEHDMRLLGRTQQLNVRMSHRERRLDLKDSSY